jgi:hypothetical protein
MTFKVKRNPDNTYKIVQSWGEEIGPNMDYFGKVLVKDIDTNKIFNICRNVTGQYVALNEAQA